MNRIMTKNYGDKAFALPEGKLSMLSHHHLLPKLTLEDYQAHIMGKNADPKDFETPQNPYDQRVKTLKQAMSIKNSVNADVSQLELNSTSLNYLNRDSALPSPKQLERLERGSNDFDSMPNFHGQASIEERDDLSAHPIGDY
jgi:hypothetical protein